MIINTQAKFIFVHIPKTAGSSMMASLQSLPGNNKHWLAKTKHETLSELHANIANRLSTVDRLTGEHPIDYYSFGFVRNPWERMSSFYRYLREKRSRPEIDTISSFKDFITQAQAKLGWISSLHSMRQQVDYFSFHDEILRIDFLGHFEHLDEDVISIAEQIKIPINLQHKNSSSNRYNDYRKDYDNEMIEIVADLFTDDCFHFGYNFESRHPKKRCSGRLDCYRQKTNRNPPITREGNLISNP